VNDAAHNDAPAAPGVATLADIAAAEERFRAELEELRDEVATDVRGEAARVAAAVSSPASPPPSRRPPLTVLVVLLVVAALAAVVAAGRRGFKLSGVA
jgi:type VI protein secretion system component VasF